ncbi:MFS transporter [Rhodococcus pyridinivorans]|uniref:MFS transporter n=1 Tax=Rhodococcus pyridinivorans TaxID=103816 RepID=UPI0039C9C727
MIGRGLHGVGVGLIPLGISLLRDVLPYDRLHSAVALMSASMGVGGALGLPASAAVAQYVHWRFLFWGVAVLGAVALGALSWVLRDVPVLRTLRRGGGGRSERGPRVPVAGDLQGCRSGLVEHPHDRFPRGCRPAARGMGTVQSMIMTGLCMAPGGLMMVVSPSEESSRPAAARRPHCWWAA